MRCRKVRSCLSAYSRDELSGRLRQVVQEHLAECEACRTEAESVHVFHVKATELSGPALPSDFNTRLLNRIAQERFVETRTKAYLPKRAPIILWRRTVPVLATLALAVYSVIAMFGGQLPFPNQSTPSSVSAGIAGLYPGAISGSQNQVMNLRKDWSLQSQLAQTARINRISGLLTSTAGFAADAHGSLEMMNPMTGERVPYTVYVFTFRPVIRVYEPNAAPQAQGANSIY